MRSAIPFYHITAFFASREREIVSSNRTMSGNKPLACEKQQHLLFIACPIHVAFSFMTASDFYTQRGGILFFIDKEYTI
jgi:hypothetical protein